MPDISYNCECTAGVGKTDTLLNLRKRMLRRMGYAAQVDSPPPGIADLFNDYLQSAQTQLIEEFRVFQGERVFVWPLLDNVRFYDYDENTADPACDKKLNPNTITFVGLEMDGYVTALRMGIPTSMVDAFPSGGYPTRYDLGQCIELWPAPVGTNMKLVVRGSFGEAAFTADDNSTTIDSECVWLHAMANAKAHAGHPDAGNYMGMLTNRIGRLVAGGHGTARYINEATDSGSVDVLHGDVHPIDSRYDAQGNIRRIEDNT